MPNWSGAETSARDGNIVGTGSPPAVLGTCNVLEQVEVFKYLGRLLAQDDDDIQAICAQMWKAQAPGAQVRRSFGARMLHLFVAAKFYQVIIQAIFLYVSESWVISRTAMARLEGLHIHAAYRMAKEHKPKRGPDRVWIYPQSEDVLKECGMKTMEEYILNCGQTVALYVATHPTLTKCRWGKRKRGAIPHQWWWEQPMDLDIHGPTGSDE